LEARFGRRIVAAAERWILFLIVLVVTLMTVEAAVDLPERVVLWFGLIDGVACAFFLAEFAVKISHAPQRARWFRRHVLIDLVPSIPVGLLTSGLTAAASLDAARYGRLLRFLRLPRLVRYVRVLRPIIRIARGFGLLTRGLDRLARQYGSVLNQNVILYPTRRELQRAAASLPAHQAELRRLRFDLRTAWKRLLIETDGADRPELARRRIDALETAASATLFSCAQRPGVQVLAAREIPAARLIEQLGTATPQDIEAGLGEDLVMQLARLLRTFARPPLCWLPVVRRCLPRINDQMADAEVASAGSRRIAAVLGRWHRAWFWVADLYGTVSPSQFVDRVGTMLVQNSFRPAYRLAMLGGSLALAELLISVLEMDSRLVRQYLNLHFGSTVLILGSVCIIVLSIGWWLKRLAREATEFYQRAAQAQFLSLTETIRGRHLRRDAEILYDRVLRPDWQRVEREEGSDGRFAASGRARHLGQLLDRVERSLVDAHAGSDGTAEFTGFDNVTLLYRDWLDGAMFTDNDTRATSQLLGNPAIRQAIRLSARLGKRQHAALTALDLVHQKTLLGGPYLWFNFISQSITHSVAGLIIDYNSHAVPLAELPMLSAEERRRYDRWLSVGETGEQPSVEEAERAERQAVTTAFTAPHFLDFDPRRDREVEQRFGPDVLRRLQRDRSLLIRRVFGTFPMHQQPKQERVINLYVFYSRWLAGGRALLAPWFLFLAGLKLLGRLLAWIGRSVQELRDPDRRGRHDAASAFFVTAVRKIERIRGPAVEAAVRLRMVLDPEYLGVPQPGETRCGLWGTGVDADMEFLAPGPQFREEVELARRRTECDMARLERLIDDGLLRRAAERLGRPADSFETAEHRRAAAVAYSADFREIRRLLSAEEILSEVCRRAPTEP
ncbi:MAG: ion transporter, partial [Planctomycetaceae bacterium]